MANDETIRGGVVLWDMKKTIADCDQIGKNTFKFIIMLESSFSNSHAGEDIIIEYIWKILQSLQDIGPDLCFFLLLV
jgi:hypothetical protein